MLTIFWFCDSYNLQKFFKFKILSFKDTQIVMLFTEYLSDYIVILNYVKCVKINT